MDREHSIESDVEKYRKSPNLLNHASFEPKIVSCVPAPRLGSIKRDKFNSTATVFATTTLVAPDVEEIVKSLSLALYWLMREHEKIHPKVLVDIFDEQKHPLGDKIVDPSLYPQLEEVHGFLWLLFHGEKLSAECAVMSLAYIERLLTLTGITLHPLNWRRVCLGAIMLASKVWEDLAVWNVDFLNVFPQENAHDLGKLERAYLSALQYTVTLKASIYAKYYFALQSIAERNEHNFPLQPLTTHGAERLENKSRGIESDAKRFHIQRSFSSEPFSPKEYCVDVDTLTNSLHNTTN